MGGHLSVSRVVNVDGCGFEGCQNLFSPDFDLSCRREYAFFSEFCTMVRRFCNCSLNCGFVYLERIASLPSASQFGIFSFCHVNANT